MRGRTRTKTDTRSGYFDQDDDNDDYYDGGDGDNDDDTTISKIKEARLTSRPKSLNNAPCQSSPARREQLHHLEDHFFKIILESTSQSSLPSRGHKTIR